MSHVGKSDDMIIERLKAGFLILVVNKIDKVHPDRALVAQIDDFRNQMDFKIVPISPFKEITFPHLIIILSENLEESFQYFPS